tara:strand:+ start:33 stop:278 length:246 start_codon:yes stop_codon:yes gene_type:complete
MSKLFIIQQLYSWWFILCTLLTVLLFHNQIMGNNFYIYILFDSVIAVLGRRIFGALYENFEQQNLVDEMLAKNRNEKTHIP